MNKLAKFYPQGHQEHFEAGHPERPERVEVVRRTLMEAGIWGSCLDISPLALPLEFLCTVHSPRYLDLLKESCARSAYLDEDTYTTCASWSLALNAAGGAAAVADLVWRSNDKLPDEPIIHGFALSRPPGHHAERDRGMGFCLMNNIAIAVEYLISFPLADIGNAKRVAIVDLDLHHGNGTQDIFYDRDDVLFISTHQSPLYPGTGALTDIGSGAGEGYTLNLPFPPATGDHGFMAAMDQVILPRLDQFKPEIILVSTGFDPHWRDPLGHLMLTAGGYGNIIQKLVQWADLNCQSRILLVLEGGYDTLAIGACALSSASALLDIPYHDTIGPSPRPEGKSWQSVIDHAKKYWNL